MSAQRVEDAANEQVAQTDIFEIHVLTKIALREFELIAAASKGVFGIASHEYQVATVVACQGEEPRLRPRLPLRGDFLHFG